MNKKLTEKTGREKIIWERKNNNVEKQRGRKKNKMAEKKTTFGRKNRKGAGDQGGQKENRNKTERGQENDLK